MSGYRLWNPEVAHAGVWRGRLAVNRLVDWLGHATGFKLEHTETLEFDLEALGLLGKEWVPADYATALSKRRGMTITIEDYPDLKDSRMRREVLQAGVLAEAIYDDERGQALVLVRESLRQRPWPAYELNCLHELAHIDLGHPVKKRSGGRYHGLFSPDPAKRYEHREALEAQARDRAKLLLLAATHPEVFARRRLNQVW